VDFSIIYLLIAIAMVILNIALILAIFKIRNNTKEQAEYLKQILAATKATESTSYLLVKKEISDIQVSRVKGIYDKAATDEVKTIPVDDWLKGYFGSEAYKIENIK